MTEGPMPLPIKVLGTPIDRVRRLEGWYFGDEGFSPEQAISYIREEAALCGAPRISVSFKDGWWILESDSDWLPSGLAGREAFLALVPYTEGGPNGSRMEVLLTTFARTVITISFGSAWIVKDDDQAKVWLDKNEHFFEGVARVIAFAV